MFWPTYLVKLLAYAKWVIVKRSFTESFEGEAAPTALAFNFEIVLFIYQVLYERL